ncbi:hypothetical protein PRIC1_014404 [Phytophthora ramorum]
MDKKRKAPGTATLRKKPRKSDKSEFVSVEVGMREFKKRLASGASIGETSATAEVEDLTQDVKATRSRTSTKPPAKKATPKKTAPNKTAAAVKKAAVKRATRQTKMTLAEVKMQLEQEQKERVEARIQALHRDIKPTTASTGSAADGPTSSSVVPATAVTAPRAVVTSAAQQTFDKPVSEAPVVPDLLDTPPSTIPPCQAPVGAAPISPAHPPASTVKNEFIADDMEEDLIFAMALEQVERKLATPQEPPISTDVVVAAASNTFASPSVQVPVASPVPVNSSLVKPPVPTQVLETAKSQLPENMAEVKLEAPAVVIAPEMLEEMGRLRKENELLKRSNELLQAAVTSPTYAANQLSHEHRTAPNGKHARVSSTRATSSDTATTSSTARYLDLRRCDSDHNMASVSEGAQPQAFATDGHLVENRDGHTEHLRESIQNGASGGNSEEPLSHGQRKFDEQNAPPVENEISKKDSSGLSTANVSKEDASTSSLPSHSEPGDNNDHSPQLLAIDHAPDQQGESASPVRAQPTEYVSEHSAHATTGSDEGNASDVSTSEVEEGEDDDEMRESNGKEEVVQNDDRIQQGDAFEVVGDGNMEGSEAVLSNGMGGPAQTPATPADSKTRDALIIIESDDHQMPGTPLSSDIIERTTAPSNSDEEEDEDDDDEVMTVKRRGRREIIASSSSSSESESESESEEEGARGSPSANELEAALRAAGGESGRKNLPKPSSSRAATVVNSTKRGASVAASSSPSLPVKTTSKKRKTPGLTKKTPSVKSSLLWPALDEFYDFLLDMTPRNVRGSEQKREHLPRYAGGKLPAQHSSIEDYCDVQLEAIMEELVASVNDSTDRRGGGRSGPTRHLSLTSVSPCGVQASTSSLGLSFGAIFSESGFTGSTSSNNDYILTFDASALGRKSSSDFMSGDLVLVRSPRWKNYEMCVFGVVLCDSVVAVGGKSNAGSKGGNSGGGDSDQICVLTRAQKRDREDAVENFGVLTELCLSNQRAPNWKWSLQQVHNTTTSAREFQAIKAISFLPNDLKQMLLHGKQAPSSKTEQASKKTSSSSSILSPRLLKYLQKHYNDSQMQAILGCLSEDSRVIIQGPPGTGKTKTILGILSALLDGAGLSTLQKAKGTARIRVGASLQSARTSAVSKTVAETSIRVLVAAPSNAAVDELVVRVLSEGLFDGGKGEPYRPRIVRVGRPETSQQQSGLAAAREASESKKNRKKMRKYAREVEEVLLESLVAKHRSTFPTVKQARQAIIKNAQIVFCTLSGAGSVAMCEFAQDFDALIIDEAAQAVEASTLIPFKFRPHRVVLVGDHRQLPATVISKKLVSMGYDRSLQQRLVENGSPVLLLTKQYRMHPEIAEFPSSYFYGGRLIQDANMREWTAQDYHRDQALKPLLFLDVQGAQSQVSGSTSLRNLSEVEVVVQLVRRLLNKFPHIEWKKRIGVIAPYKQQIYEVRGALGRLESECDRPLGIEVNTVDGFQGREKEIIIYSCVRTSHGGRRKKQRRSHDEERDVLDAFWADERRMNVAITRAKSSLWIVGNSTLLQQSPAWRALIQHTKDHDRYVGDAASTLLAGK